MDRELKLLEWKLEELQEKIYRKKCELIFKQTGLQSNEIAFSDWFCSKSPINTCVYDDVVDPIHDYCVFCGRSEDRK